jgi:hypothetical protein
VLIPGLCLALFGKLRDRLPCKLSCGEAFVTPEQIIAVVTALLSAEPDPTAFPAIRAGGADARYPVTVEACPTHAVPPTEVEGSTLICGRVNVPESHDKPDGTRIDLAFAVLKARTQSPVPDPVIYLHGGPGGGAVKSLAGIVQPLFEDYRSRRDVVTVDQRAAGISSDMVTCFDTPGGNLYEFLDPSQFTDEKQNTFFQTFAAELNAKGNNLSAYKSVQNARGVQALMLALGYHDPVTSSIPALVLFGLNDTQTSSADAKDAAASLGKACVLGFPEAGHGALMFSKCAKDIGLAFIEQPEAKLATACIEGLKPNWVLPPG